MRGLTQHTLRLLAGLLCSLALNTPAAPAAAQTDPAPPLPPPVTTGDALWDRYSAAVYLRLTQPREDFPGWHPACLPDAELAGWTELYSDPRFWELRCWTRVASAGYRALAEEHSDKPRPQGMPGPWSEYESTLTFFEVAEARGGQSISMALFAQQHRAVIFANRGILMSGGDFDDGWILPEDQRSNLDFMYTIVGNEGASLARLSSQYPAHAWPHYLLARHYAKLGQTEQALRELETGNGLPDHSLPALFPQSAAEGHVFALQDEGNLAVAASVLDAAIAVEAPALLHDSFAAPLIEMALSERDAKLASTLSRFCARVGLSRPGDLNFAAFGLNHGLELYSGWIAAIEDPQLRSSLQSALFGELEENSSELTPLFIGGLEYGAVPENRAAWFWIVPLSSSSSYWELRRSGAERATLEDWLARNILINVQYMQLAPLEDARFFGQLRSYSALTLESYAQAQYENALKPQLEPLLELDYALGEAAQQATR